MNTESSAKPPTTTDRWLHCNGCFTMPEQGTGTQYYFVTCGHIFCRNCCAKGAGLAKAGTCLLCKKERVQYMDINRNIHAKFRNLFRPMKDVANECMTEMQRVIDFQQRHKNSLVRHFSDKNQKVVTFAKSVRVELEKQKGKEQGFVKERGELLEHVERLRKENEMLRSQMERMRQSNQRRPPQRQQDFASMAPDSGFGSNETMSCSFIDAITSTPIVDLSNARRHLAAAFQTSGGIIPSPIHPAGNYMLTTPAMLGLSKAPTVFHSRGELQTARTGGGEDRQILTDRRPKSRKVEEPRKNPDGYMDFD